MRNPLIAIIAGLALGAISCDSPKTEDTPAPSTKPGELKQASDTKMSKEELEKARKEAGFKSFEEQAAENMAAMEKGNREYIKRRLTKYRDMLKGMRSMVDDIESQSAKWAEGKGDFAKFEAAYKDDAKDFRTAYNELTGNGLEGGNTQAKIAKAMRSWENINNDLGPDIAKESNFKTALEEVRKDLDEVDKDIDAIEKDDTLDGSGGEDAAADGKGDEKADAKADENADDEADDEADG
jgi:hypothetical protein